MNYNLYYLRRRYERWLDKATFQKIVHDGLLDTSLSLWSWMLEVMVKDPYTDLDVKERTVRFYTSPFSNIDGYLVAIIKATGSVLNDEPVDDSIKASEIRSISLEDYLTDNYGRPLPLPLIQEQYMRVCKQFIDALDRTYNITKRAYYLRRYEWLILEGQRWTEYWAFPISD